MTPKKPRTVGQRMGIAAAILAVSILLSRVLGFLREAAVAYLHGASLATDAYYAAFTLPDMMNYFLAGGTLSITFIPLFSSYVSRDDEEGGWKLFSNIATTMGLALVVAAIGLIILAPTFIALLFPGFTDPDQIELAITMTRIVIPAQLAFYLGGLIQATLFVREVFWPSAIAPLVYNLSIITCGIALEPFVGIMGFSYGVLLGAFLGPLGIPLWAARRRIVYRPRIAIRDRDFRQFVFLTLPLMIGVGLTTVDEWLLRFFGSMGETGSITWLNNSRKLMLVGFAVIGQAAGQAALPYLTRLFHEEKHAEMGEVLAESLRRVAFLSVIATAGLILIARPAVFVVFRRGQYSAADAEATAALLIVFAVGLLAWTTQTLAVRGFYARKDTMTPMIVSTVVAALAIPLYWLLHREMGLTGLALATTIGMSMNSFATIAVYRWRYQGLPLRPVALGTFRGALYSAAGALPVVAFMVFLPPFSDAFTGQLLTLALYSGVFVGTAGGLIWWRKPGEARVLIEKIQRRIRRRSAKS